MIVQSTIAHVTIKKISDSRSAFEGFVDFCEANMPLLSASADMRKPISPLATMADESMAGGYREIGFFGSGDVACTGWLVVTASEIGADVRDH